LVDPEMQLSWQCQTLHQIASNPARTTAKLASEPELLAAPESRGIQWSNGQYKNMQHILCHTRFVLDILLAPEFSENVLSFS
jgi:hypothetical protein